MSKRYILSIDSGNTFIKWGLHDCSGWIIQNKVNQERRATLVEHWQNLPKPSFIIGSNVAGIAIQKELSTLCAIWQLEPHWISAVSQQCGVRNLYLNPCQLGSDRWAALIAAWNQQLHATLVVNIGTAMTVDALSDSGGFLGGLILPGPDLMMNALNIHTAIPCKQLGNFEEFPVTTADAIYSGVIHSLAGTIERMACKLSTYRGSSVDNCIISGGGSAMVLPHLRIPVKVVNNLVLEGLLLIANDLLSRQGLSL